MVAMDSLPTSWEAMWILSGVMTVGRPAFGFGRGRCGPVTFVSESVAGKADDMAKLITPVRKPKGRDLSMSERDYKNQISSLRTPVERAVASLKT